MGQGLAAPIDVLEAETQVATFNQRIFSAQAALTRAENALKTFIVAGSASPLWASALHATTPPTGDAAIASLEEALRAARANRPELTQAAIAADTQEAETRFFSDQRKPQIDLVGTYLERGPRRPRHPDGREPVEFRHAAAHRSHQHAVRRFRACRRWPAFSSGGGSTRSSGADRRLRPIVVQPGRTGFSDR